MQVISNRTDFKIEEKTAVAIGKFDGIHLGHQKLLQTILDKKKEGYLAVVFTFSPSATLFFGKEGERELTTRDEKRNRFEKMGVDILIEYPLNFTTAAMKPEDFIRKLLVSQLHIGFIAAGDDISFGYRGMGKKELLFSLADTCHYEVQIIAKEIYEQREISSTYIRETIEQGNMELVSRLLGYEYELLGEIEEAKYTEEIAGTMIRVYPEQDKLLPPCGKYQCRVLCEGQTCDGVSRIERVSNREYSNRICIMIGLPGVTLLQNSGKIRISLISRLGN